MIQIILSCCHRLLNGDSKKLISTKHYHIKSVLEKKLATF